MSPKWPLKLISRHKRAGGTSSQERAIPATHSNVTHESDEPKLLPSPSVAASWTSRFGAELAPPKLRLQTDFLHPSRPSPGSTPSDTASASDARQRSPSQLGGGYTTPQGPLDVKPSPTGSSSGHIFPNASNFSIEKIHVENVNRESPGWEMLRKFVAADALYDSAARFDAPKCDEDTRVEVLSEIMAWARSEDAPQTLLCITGPAGAGKSAIMQTLCITSDSEEHKILGASFFFSGADPSRNTTTSFVATLAFQFALALPDVRSAISIAVEQNPLIFTKSIEKQFATLIVGPYLRTRHLLPPTSPYLILIDGVDECKDEERQDELLRAINRCIKDGDTPFRFVVASRPEWAIFSALQRNGHLHGVAYHIELNNGYDARLDIERFLRRRFGALGQTLGLEVGWPGEPIVQRLALNASGQFVYVATVMKYISDRRASPVERLQAVLSWTPGASSRSRPFVALDSLYTAILINARDNFQAIDSNEHDLVLLLHTLIRLWQDGSKFAHRRWLKPDWGKFLCLAGGSIHSLIVDLRSLTDVTYRGKSAESLVFYHKSFIDFLLDPARSMGLFKPVEEVEDLILELALRHLRGPTTPDLNGPDDAFLDSHVFDVSVETLAIFLEEETDSPTHSIAAIIDIVRHFSELKLWPEVFKRRRIPETISARRDYIEKIVNFLHREEEPSLAHRVSRQTHFLTLSSRALQGDGLRTPSSLSPSSPRSGVSRSLPKTRV